VILANLKAQRLARRAARLQNEAVKPADNSDAPLVAASAEAVKPADNSDAPLVAASAAATCPVSLPTSPARPPIIYFNVPSHSPARPKNHCYFDKWLPPQQVTPHEELFRAAVPQSPKYHATGPRRTKLLRPLPPPPPKVDTVTVETQTVWTTFKNQDTQTDIPEPLTRADLRADLATELQFWLGFLVHLH